MPDSVSYHDELRDTLQAVWDECNEYLVFEPVRERVKAALGIREFSMAQPIEGDDE